WLFGFAFLYAILALSLSLRNYWRAIAGGALNFKTVSRALNDAARLKYLDGGGAGCVTQDHRRLYHHLTFYGFLLCFLAPAVATIYHYTFQWEAPYRWFDLPVLLGTAGGLGLVCGTIGLSVDRSRRDESLKDKGGLGGPLLALLGLTGATGLALLALRATPALG